MLATPGRPPSQVMASSRIERPRTSAKAIIRSTRTRFCFGGLLLLRHIETLLGVLDPMKCLLA
jgi:hypothetical protein